MCQTSNKPILGIMCTTVAMCGRRIAESIEVWGLLFNLVNIDLSLTVMVLEIFCKDVLRPLQTPLFADALSVILLGMIVLQIGRMGSERSESEISE